MAYVKLDAGLLDSSLWLHEHDVIRVFIFLLLKADARGEVHATVPAIAHQCMVPLQRCREILEMLASPDPDSRSPEHDGRRIAIQREPSFVIKILNYQKYREKDHTNAIRQARFRKKADDSNAVTPLRNAVTPLRNAVTPLRNAVTPLRNGVTPLPVTEADAEAEAEEKEEYSRPAEYEGGYGGETPLSPSSANADSATAPVAGDEAPVLIFPCVGKEQEWPLTRSLAEELSALFPGVDIVAEARRALAWIRADPARRKTARGMRRFLTSWISRAVDSGRYAKANVSARPPEVQSEITSRAHMCPRCQQRMTISEMCGYCREEVRHEMQPMRS